MLHVPILVVLLVMETFSILNCQLQEHAILHKSISGFKTQITKENVYLHVSKPYRIFTHRKPIPNLSKTSLQ